MFSKSTGPNFIKFSGLDTFIGLDELVVHFAIAQGTFPWKPILGEIWQFSLTHPHSAH